ncbi:MAG: SpoIIIAH-like family protein [Syntrophomonas sp.]|uniref:SpoIIIAH-like family protein n=1 Tax=Syntrophomonas sp. TaxID=2053627 RepID=UPI002631A5C0|nr:SpoIIIAH-like family protein [Syntrophomonas sp.]MDD2510245.1 SpoIIIAH-like family protein [Syntrophomonas sp.]MDD3878803.1 SpoIIIAH-like family protein [Syntrophomonas sp.]MDD4626829.1 SpoIIIAH-like family protein [Syntrophomonas sp.]
MKKEIAKFWPFLWKIEWRKIFLVLLVLILMAVGVKWKLYRTEGDDIILPSSEQNSAIGELSTVDSSQINKMEVPKNNFFSTYRLERECIRGKQLDILKGIMENKDNDEKAREMASLRMVKISEDMEKEMRLESLVKSEGIEECVALVQAGITTVIVPAGAVSQERQEELREMLLSLLDSPENKLWLKEAGK